jgi:hypothetical protein
MFSKDCLYWLVKVTFPLLYGELRMVDRLGAKKRFFPGLRRTGMTLLVIIKPVYLMWSVYILRCPEIYIPDVHPAFTNG